MSFSSDPFSGPPPAATPAPVVAESDEAPARGRRRLLLLSGTVVGVALLAVSAVVVSTPDAVDAATTWPLPVPAVSVHDEGEPPTASLPDSVLFARDPFTPLVVDAALSVGELTSTGTTGALVRATAEPTASSGSGSGYGSGYGSSFETPSAAPRQGVTRTVTETIRASPVPTRSVQPAPPAPVPPAPSPAPVSPAPVPAQPGVHETCSAAADALADVYEALAPGRVWNDVSAGHRLGRPVVALREAADATSATALQAPLREVADETAAMRTALVEGAATRATLGTAAFIAADLRLNGHCEVVLDPLAGP